MHATLFRKKSVLGNFDFCSRRAWLEQPQMLFWNFFGGVAKSSNIKCHGAVGEDGEGRLKRNFGNKEPRAKTD